MVLKRIISNLSIENPIREEDVYFSLMRAIVSQQLSTKVADTIFKRFLALFAGNYPMPEALQSMDLEKLRNVGLSKQKASYIQNVANFELHQGMAREQLDKMKDDEVIAYLTQIKGVGKWTVEMLLMFHLNRLDVFPVDDLGIQQAMKRLYGLEESGKALKAKMTAIAENWKPYRTIACKYLWKWKDNSIEKAKENQKVIGKTNSI